MPHSHPFVGRKTELEEFEAILVDPAPQAVLVVGHQGMGKTMLVNKLAKNARKYPGLECGAVRHEVTKTGGRVADAGCGPAGTAEASAGAPGAIPGAGALY